MTSANAFSMLAHYVPTFVITAGCVILLLKQRSLPSVLLLVGNVLGIAVRLGSTLYYEFLRRGHSHLSLELLNTLISAVALLAGITFAIGFLLLALRAGTGAARTPDA